MVSLQQPPHAMPAPVQESSEESMIAEEMRKSRRRWIWGCVIFLCVFCLFYITQIPTEFHPTPESTGLENPTFHNDGKVDYFAACEELYKDRLEPPQDNGFRMLLVACGPRLFGQEVLLDEIPWSQFDTNPRLLRFRHEHWIPLCEKLQIDPNAEPPYYSNRSFQEFYANLEKTHPGLRPENLPFDSQEYTNFRLEFADILEKWNEIPRDSNEYRELAQWLQNRSPVLDIFNEAVRKPNFVCPALSPDSIKMGWMKVGWVDSLASLTRNSSGPARLTQDLQIRISDRLGKIRNGQSENTETEIENAWYDAMSVFHLTRKPFALDVRTAHMLEKSGFDAAVQIVKLGNPTSTQLERFAKELDSFPEILFPKNELLLRKYAALDSIIYTDYNPFSTARSTSFLSYLDHFVVYLPLDRNILGKQLVRHFERSGFDEFTQSDFRYDNYHDLKTRLEDIYDYGERYEKKLNAATILSQLAVQTRSQCAADIGFHEFAPSRDAGYFCERLLPTEIDSFYERMVRMDILRTMIALERFQREHGEYPETLEKLVPQFLAEVSIDPFASPLEPLGYERNAVSSEGLYRLFSHGNVELYR